jgi:hypothetical protein
MPEAELITGYDPRTNEDCHFLKSGVNESVANTPLAPDNVEKGNSAYET